MTWLRLILSLFTLLFMGCRSNTHSKLSNGETAALNKQDSLKQENDTVFLVNGIKFTYLPLRKCAGLMPGSKYAGQQQTIEKVRDINHRIDFLNDFVRCYMVDSIESDRLMTKNYYVHLLRNTHFLDFAEDAFENTTMQFSVTEESIASYGSCYVARFYFPDTPGAGQRTTAVMVNAEKKEISIWYFDNITVSSKGIDCDFNLRGSHTVYQLQYLEECNGFIPLAQRNLREGQ